MWDVNRLTVTQSLAGFCTGTVDASGRIKLTCANGASDRRTGHAVLRSGTLVVNWAGGPKDVLHRRAG